MITIKLLDGTEQQVPASNVRVPVKVNGEQRLIGGDQAIRDYQMASAGQEKLRLATQRLQRAHQLEQQHNSGQRPDNASPTGPAVNGTGPAASQPNQPDAGQPGTEATSDQEALEAARALQYGSEAEVAAALAKLKGRDTSGATPEELVERAIARAFQVRDAETAHRDAETAYRADIETFGGEFEDVVNDPDLRGKAAQLTHGIRAKVLTEELGYDVRNMDINTLASTYAQEVKAGTISRTNLDVLREAGDLARKWADGFAQRRTSTPTTPTPEPSSFDAKRERKRSGGTPPPAASARTPEHTPTKRTRSDVIAEMKESRRGRPNPHMAARQQ